MEHTEQSISERTSPPRWHYAVGALVVLAGVVAFGVALWIEIDGYKPNIRVVVPGTHEIELNPSGKWTIYYEYDSIVEHLVFNSSRTLEGLLVGVTRVGDPGPLDLTRVTERESYETGRFAGSSILTFDAPTEGMYEITGAYPGQFQGSESIVLAIGRPGLLRPVVTVAIFLVAGVLIGGFVLVRTFVRRRDLAA